MVIRQVASDHPLQVLSHLFKFLSQNLDALDLVLNDAWHLSLLGVLDILQEHLHTNLLLLGGLNGAWSVGEESVQVSILIDLLASQKCHSWDSNQIFILHVDERVDWHGVVSSQNLVDLNVILLD